MADRLHVQRREILHFGLFCGLGGGAKGFNAAKVRLGPVEATFRCLGGIDSDPAAVRDFERLAGVKGTCLDLFDRDQYAAFHGREPGPGWRQAEPDDVRRAARGEHPHILFLSAPCKGFSGLLSEARSSSARYQALNRLTLRGVWLAMEAWAQNLPEFVIFENVPRIMTRGRALLDQITHLLRHYGYAVVETTHDCGELGGLAQSRKRFLMVARHAQKVPPCLYQPPRRPLRGVGEVLDRLPLPGDVAAGGPMHRVPVLQWRTWVRLAFVEAGSDWRSLNKLRVEDGMLADYAILPESEWHGGALGVRRWEDPSGTVSGKTLPGNGAFSVADPRIDEQHRGTLGVREWEQPARTVTTRCGPSNGTFAVADPRYHESGGSYGQYAVGAWSETASTIRGIRSPIQGRFSVADPRHHGPAKHCNEFRIVPWAAATGAVTGAHGTGQCVADPRSPPGAHLSKYRVSRADEPAGTVIGASTTGDGAFAVADPRYADWHPGASSSKLRVTGWNDTSRTITGSQQVASGAQAVADPRQGAWQRGMRRAKETGEAWASAGHYGVVGWNQTSGAVSAAAGHDNGRCSVADPRPGLPLPDDRLVCRIEALDGTWHRPFTTLELAALQSLVDPEELLELDGLSDAAWRERIGNAVPPSAAQAIAEEMGRTLLLAWAGEGFALSNVPIWVRPVAAAVSVIDQHQAEEP